jgi:hypothetical protein
MVVFSCPHIPLWCGVKHKVNLPYLAHSVTLNCSDVLFLFRFWLTLIFFLTFSTVNFDKLAHWSPSFGRNKIFFIQYLFVMCHYKEIFSHSYLHRTIQICAFTNFCMIMPTYREIIWGPKHRLFRLSGLKNVYFSCHLYHILVPYDAVNRNKVSIRQLVFIFLLSRYMFRPLRAILRWDIQWTISNTKDPLHVRDPMQRCYMLYIGAPTLYSQYMLSHGYKYKSCRHKIVKTANSP